MTKAHQKLREEWERDAHGVKLAEKDLFDFLTPLLRLTEEERFKLEELLHDFVRRHAEERASDALDSEFNRGRWSRD